ncbi:DUF6199 family natural product biosynthesis protein [Acutalibacter sp. 1XD8-36]|uniref:DUF6199 family natural product biosynthesis protein n=1 Tax=Acutalibacter sp. 1XD8-36 TaxID=2320852 RepID=UPI0014136AB5|nr:DUF6199 family natural product biosynthesis protein [Acutalibacter sp. 1XD8-36]NBJ88754.1 hypothetical protein [Acutalibacter sp. 1XD8-36]
MYILLAIAISIAGAVMLIKPEIIYKVTESWKSNTTGEPSDLYILSTRIGGGFFMLVGIAGAIALAVLS